MVKMAQSLGQISLLIDKLIPEVSEFPEAYVAVTATSADKHSLLVSYKHDSTKSPVITSGY